MQQTIVKSFHRGLDRDTDIRLLQNGSYRNATNIKVSNSMSGRVGVVTNIPGYGNTSDSILMGGTGDVVIGVFPDKINNYLYTFIAAPTSSLHRIIRYNPATGAYTLVVMSSLLAFSATYRITAFDVVENFIFWTDGNSEPKVYDTTLNYLTLLGLSAYAGGTPYTINNLVTYNGIVYKALGSTTGNAPTGTLVANSYWTVDLTQQYDITYFNVAVVVPNKAPVITVATDTNVATNNIVGKYLQFKYRFVFKSGQKSIFSPISTLAYSALDYQDRGTTAGETVSNNMVTISVSNSNANRLVDKIEIACRSGNQGDFNLIHTQTVTAGFFSSGIDYDFYNNGVSIPIAISESNQLYDDIPLKAAAQRYTNNRMMYGNTLNGYDKPTVSLDSLVAIGDSTDTSSTSYETPDMLHLTDLTGTTLDGYLSVPDYAPAEGDVIVAIGLSSCYMSFTVLAGWGFADIVTQLNTFAWVASDAGNTQMLFFITKGGSQYGEIFKSGARYQVGIQYYDTHGRTNGVLIDTDSEVYIPTIAERGLTPSVDTRAGGCQIVVKINNTPPAWAKYYSIVWANTYKDAFTLTTTIMDAKAGVASGTVIADMNSIKLSRTTYKTSLVYTYEPGDRVRFITYDDSGANAAGTKEWADKVYDAEITAAYENYAGTDGHYSIEFYLPNGLAVNQVKYSTVEIYRPSQSFTAGQVLFQESPSIFNITNGIHEGDIDQSISGTKTGTYFGVWLEGGVKKLKITTANINAEIKTGDVIALTGTYNESVTVSSVLYKPNYVIEISLTSATWGASGAASGTMSFSGTTKAAIVCLTHGDAYYKVRTLNNASFFGCSVEDYNMSDYTVPSMHYSAGRPTAIIEQKQQSNIATIFYSETFIPNTYINGLNRIYPDVNYEEYSKNFGSIIYLHDEGNAMIMFQEDKISQIMVDQSINYDSDGAVNYLNSTNTILSKAMPYSGEYGMKNPFSFAYFGNRKYFVDISRGVACRLSTDGITEISRAGMRGWFYDICRDTLAAVTNLNISGVYDPSSDEYTMCFEQQQKAISYNEELNDGNGGFSSFTTFLFTGGATIDNKVFVSQAGYVYEIDNTYSAIPRNTIRSGGGDTLLPSSIEFVCNENPGIDKSFLAVAIDGNDAWDVVISTEQGQLTHLYYNQDFRTRETEYQAAILRDENTPNLLAGTAIFNGDKIRGKEATILLTMTAARAVTEKYIKLFRLVVSQS